MSKAGCLPITAMYACCAAVWGQFGTAWGLLAVMAVSIITGILILNEYGKGRD